MVRLGTRGSALALAQARLVAHALEEAGTATELVPIRTSGDAVGDKSRFVREIESALIAGEVELAVHSAKDVPGELPPGLVIAGTPPAGDPRDALAGARSLAALPAGARVGTTSLRRRSQLLALRDDLEPAELRGNVDTRLTKLAAGDYDAIVLALAGLQRLEREDVGVAIAVEEMVPAAGQGIIAVEARGEDESSVALAQAVSDDLTMTRLTAERAAVAALDASCHTPVGVHATIEGERIVLQAYAGLPDGSEWIRDRVEGDAGGPVEVGSELAARMKAAGVEDILKASSRWPS